MRKMKLIKLTINLFLFFIGIPPIYAYDGLTHNKITKEAYNLSVLNSGDLDNIGISGNDTFDTSSISNYGKMIDSEDTLPVNDGTPLGWLREGSIDEDDYTIIPPFFRFNNHFYNPINGAGLNFTLLGVFSISGYPAPSWGLEDDTSYNEQLYSIKHARDYFFDGLTKPAKTDREKNIALTFRTLGQVVHLIEDMAQPQHTRNDPHGGFFGAEWGPQILGQKSRYEFYVNRNDKRNTFAYGGYPVAAFDDYRSYFVTTDGKGISQFSNRNFVTHVTNFTQLEQGNYAPGFPEPTLDLTQKDDVDIQITDIWGNSLTGVVTFFKNTITDNYSGISEINNKMTTYSLFDQDLKNKNKNPAFTLNDFNHEAAANILLKRAVGYSAGLLNYFFRGQIDMVPDPNSPGNYIIENDGNEAFNPNGNEGVFTLYYDANDNQRHQINWNFPSDGRISVPAADANGPGESMSVSFTEPTDAMEPGKYILVYKGTLGNEQDIAVVGKEVTNTAYLLVTDLWGGWVIVNGDNMTIVANDTSTTNGMILGEAGVDTDDRSFYPPYYGSPYWTPAVRKLSIQGELSTVLTLPDKTFQSGAVDSTNRILYLAPTEYGFNNVSVVDLNSNSWIKDTSWSWADPTEDYDVEVKSISYDKKTGYTVFGTGKNSYGNSFHLCRINPASLEIDAQITTPGRSINPYGEEMTMWRSSTASNGYGYFLDSRYDYSSYPAVELNNGVTKVDIANFQIIREIGLGFIGLAVAADNTGHIYVLNYGSGIRIEKFDAELTHLATFNISGYNSWGPSVNLRVDSKGNIYLVANTDSYHAFLLKVGADGILKSSLDITTAITGYAYPSPSSIALYEN